MRQLKDDINVIRENSESLTQVITLLLQVRETWEGRGWGRRGGEEWRSWNYGRGQGGWAELFRRGRGLQELRRACS